MKIYTSYFGNIKKITNPVSIAIKPPHWYSGHCYLKLAPKWDLVSKFKIESKKDLNAAIAMYTRAYTEEILGILYQTDVFNELYQIYHGQDIVLLCYETPEKFCHRYLVADWFGKIGINVMEASNG
jgi:hypothetical protein